MNYIFDLHNTIIGRSYWPAMMNDIFPCLDEKRLRHFVGTHDFGSIEHCLQVLASKMGVGANEQFIEKNTRVVQSYHQKARWMPEAKQVLWTLRSNGAKLGLISNCTTLTEGMFHQLDVAPYFDVVAFSHKLGYAKPQDEIYLHTLKEMKLDSKEVTMVGDLLEKDVLKPIELGMQAILIDREDKEPDYHRRIHSLKELLY